MPASRNFLASSIFASIFFAIIGQDPAKTELVNITNNIDTFHYNKAIANIYELINTLQTNIKKGAVSKKCVILTLKNLSLLLQPFVPHLSEELWKLLGENDMVINQKWPKTLGINKKTSYNNSCRLWSWYIYKECKKRDL